MGAGSVRARDLWKRSLQLKARDYATCLSIVSAATSGEAAGFMQMGRALSGPHLVMVTTVTVSANGDLRLISPGHQVEGQNCSSFL